MAWLLTDWTTTGYIIVTTIGIFIAVLLAIRVNGLRTLSKMSSYDFAVTVAIGSLIAATAVAKTPSLGEGVIALVVLIACQRIVSMIRANFAVSHWIDNSPRVLMTGTDMHHETMRQVRVTSDDIMAKLREANVTHLDQVLSVIIETTGDISVLHASPGTTLDPRLMQGVTSSR